MTAKRFSFEIKTQGNEAYTQWHDNGKPINSAETLCGLLNELHDEKQSVIDWIDNKIEEIKPYNSELCRATLLELKEFLK